MVRAHSTQAGGGRSASWGGKVLLLTVLAAAPAIAAPGPGAGSNRAMSSAHWIRIERRIESGYFRQNAAALQAVSAALAAKDDSAAAGSPDEEWRSYYAALVAYRLALLAMDDAARPGPLAQQCVDRLNATLVIDTRSAEALALQSACYALQSRLDSWRAPLAAPLSLARSDKALRLAPDNPRVLLLAALAARDRPRLFGGNWQQAFDLMRRAALAFERQSAGPRGIPGWGAADAFTELARDYLSRGEAVAARNALERALLVAPDFGQARHLMAEIVSG